MLLFLHRDIFELVKMLFETLLVFQVSLEVEVFLEPLLLKRVCIYVGWSVAILWSADRDIVVSPTVLIVAVLKLGVPALKLNFAWLVSITYADFPKLSIVNLQVAVRG